MDLTKRRFLFISWKRTDIVKWLNDLLDKTEKMDKTKWLILGLGGILLLVIALPAQRSQRAEEEAVLEQTSGETTKQDHLILSYKKQLAGELEQALECMEGVGNVRVMITFQDSGEAVVEKDVTKSSGGQNDSLQNSQYQESTIYQETNGREPYISQQKLPAVEGVLIIAQGGADSKVKQEIKDAVTALFPIEAHKIKIVKMQDS